MEKFNIYVCKNYQKETERVLELLDYQGYDLHIFSADCGRPPLAYSDLVEDSTSSKSHILFGSICTSKLVKESRDNWCLNVIDSFFKHFLNSDIVDSYIKDGAYLITPGWLKNWESQLSNWGFTQNEAADFFKESCSYLLLLDTGVYDEADRWLKEFSQYLSIEARTLPVGLDYYRLKIKEQLDPIMRDSLESEKNDKAKQEFADFAMAFDLISQLVKKNDESGVFRTILMCLELLFAPGKLCYATFRENECGELWTKDLEVFEDWQLKIELCSLSRNFRIHDDKKGFDLLLEYDDERLAVVRISSLSFPEKMDHYLNLSLFLREVFALAIINSRSFQTVLRQKQLLSDNEIKLKEDALELEQSLQSLEIRNKELDAFSHMVAHDLKSPLASIIGIASTLVRKDVSLSAENISEFNLVMKERSEKMIQIIDALLLFSGVKKTKVKLEMFDMANVVNESLHQLESQIVSSQSEIVLPKDSWPSLVSYAPWLEEVWTNYIGNALKYGGGLSKIELGFDVLASDDFNGFRFWVKDSGAGISQENIQKVFDSFERLDQVGVEGTGLGLSIVQRIIERLGGNVGVESSQDVSNHGSIFYFTLPVDS